MLKQFVWFKKKFNEKNSDYSFRFNFQLVCNFW